MMLTNNKATIYSAEELGVSAEDGGKWVLVCEPHGQIVQDTNKKRLAQWKNHSAQWCSDCQEAGA